MRRALEPAEQMQFLLVPHDDSTSSTARKENNDLRDVALDDYTFPLSIPTDVLTCTYLHKLRLRLRMLLSLIIHARMYVQSRELDPEHCVFFV